MKIEIKHRWTGSVPFSIEATSVKEAVEKAVAEKVNLSGSNLRGSNLRGSNLSGSDLSGSDLSGSNLRGSDLRGSDLSGSNLRGSDLSGSNLSGSNLRGSDLRGSNLSPIRNDFWAVLISAPTEVLGLRKAIIEGRIDGSNYTGDCACLVGTIAKVRGVAYREMPNLKPDSARPSERFFLGINKGDTPETNQASKLAVEWIDQWLAAMEAASAPAPTGETACPLA